MITKKPWLMKKGILLLLIGLSFFLVYLYFLGGVTALADLSVRLQTVNLPYYSLAFISIILCVLLSSLAWHRLLSLLSIRVGRRKVFLYVWVGTFVDLLVPAESISGDASKVYLMSKNSNANSGKVAASVVGHRILSMTVTFGGLIVSSVYFVLKYRPPALILDFIVIVASCSVFSIVLLGYLCLREQTTRRIVNWVISLATRIFRGRWELTSLRSKAQKMLRAFHRGMNVLAKYPKGLAWPVVLSIASWFFHVLVAFFVFASIGVEIPLSAIVLVYSISITLQGVPIGVPGEIGFMEAVMTTLYTMLGFGIDVSAAAAATLLIRIITLWFRLAVGYASVQWIGIKALMGSKQ
jgi:uncharacterized protein (TIRG00374 family)